MANKNFPALKNDLILRAAKGESTEKSPVWIMRQAGRYLPEFQEIRKKHEFFEICKTPELAAEVTLQPIRKFDLDAAIIFSDILVIPQALGVPVEMRGAGGIQMPLLISSPGDMARLQTPVDVKAKLGYVFEAITLTRHKLEGKVPLIGFSGAPWTLMSYMVQGAGAPILAKSKSWLYKYPDSSHKFLQLITDVIVDYLVGQAEAGAQMLQVFESNADQLGPELFDKYCLPYLQDISSRVKSELQKKGLEPVPMIVFAKGANYALEELGRSGYEVISIDWTVDPAVARAAVGTGVTLQGNLDPCALYSSKGDLEDAVKTMIGKFGSRRHIANLGHGIYPDMEPSSVKIFIDAVHKYSQELPK